MSDLPEPLARFVERSGAIAPGTDRVMFEQRGEMRLKPGARFLPFTAEQWMATREVAFCWHARAKMAPLLTAVVEDAYEDGHGRLDAKMWGAVPVAHGEGPDVDRGEVQRYLAELPWNPRAFRENPALRFEARPDRRVRVWTGEPSCYVDLTFDAEGDIAASGCDNRPRGDEGPHRWQGRFFDYVELGGLRVPRRGEVAWLLDEGEFLYWRGEVTGLEQV